ncbi:MAG: DUF2095 family protein [Candidatus Nezhaarchaeales archaeon]
MEYELSEFRKRFPNLAKELEAGTRSLSELVESVEPPSMPTVVDYLRRCKTMEEAKEVLEYLVRTGQLREEERDVLEKVLNNEGLESLGPRKEFGYYSERYIKYIRKDLLRTEGPRDCIGSQE